MRLPPSQYISPMLGARLPSTLTAKLQKVSSSSSVQPNTHLQSVAPPNLPASRDPMAVDRHLTLASRAIRRESLQSLQDVVSAQRLLDSSAEGFTMERLAHLVGPGVAEHASELEGLYQQMLLKLEGLSRMVEKGSSRVLEQICSLV